MITLESFHHELLQDIHLAADAGGRYLEDEFFERFCDQLVDAGELTSYDHSFYAAPRGMRVDGYEGDPLTLDGTLTLIVSDFNQAPTISTLTSTELVAVFKRILNFLKESRRYEFRSKLDESMAAFGLAEMMSKRWPMITKIRLLLISNRVLSARVDGMKAGSEDGIPIAYSVWDLSRLYRFEMSGQGREEIEIDLEKDFGGALPVLPAHLGDADYQAYLAVVPGRQLAEIYDHWGARLLEQNVRVFLQARGNVNKGIKNTLENDPTMFFAYNNGITATAECVTTKSSSDGLLLTHLKNLQIVNGGQTTASIHAASRKKDVDLSNVFVQMKLSIVEPALAQEIVPKISEYANSQNRVNAADFFSNHPFHIRMEEFSRRILAPSREGGFRESKWFYERARGQYQEARSRLTPAKLKEFELEFPRPQVFTKTDMAKYVNVWRGLPDVVSKGAQKNFAEFAQYIGKEWDDNPDSFNETFYRDAISKGVIFQTVEKLVTEQEWYGGGYRANIVAYAISKLVHDVTKMGYAIDLDRVWRSQALSEHLREALRISATAVNGVITNPPSSSRNVTEWAKQQACWVRVRDLRVSWPESWLDQLSSRDEQKSRQASAAKDQQMLNGIQAQMIILNAGADLWREVRDWGSTERLISPTEAGVLDVAASIPYKLPTEKQSLRIVQTLKRLHGEGCPLGRDLL
jgi:hypothetical protein